MRLGEPSDGSGGTLEGQAQSQPFKKLYKNPLEIPKGILSQGNIDLGFDSLFGDVEELEFAKYRRDLQSQYII